MFASDFGLDHRRNRSFQVWIYRRQISNPERHAVTQEIEADAVGQRLFAQPQKELCGDVRTHGIATSVHITRSFTGRAIPRCVEWSTGAYGESCCGRYPRSANHAGRITLVPLRLRAPAHRKAGQRYACVSQAASARSRASGASAIRDRRITGSRSRHILSPRPQRPPLAKSQCGLSLHTSTIQMLARHGWSMLTLHLPRVPIALHSRV